MMDRKCAVLDITFGLNNQDQIKAMKKRGTLARLLDLEQYKLQLMGRYRDAYSEHEVHEQAQQVRALKVRFVEACELVKMRKCRVEARTAFVTFDSEEAYERVKRAYSYSSFSPSSSSSFSPSSSSSSSFPSSSFSRPSSSAAAHSQQQTSNQQEIDDGPSFVAKVKALLGLNGQPEELRYKGTEPLVLEGGLILCLPFWHGTNFKAHNISLRADFQRSDASVGLPVGKRGDPALSSRHENLHFKHPRFGRAHRWVYLHHCCQRG